MNLPSVAIAKSSHSCAHAVHDVIDCTVNPTPIDLGSDSAAGGSNGPWQKGISILYKVRTLD